MSIQENRIFSPISQPEIFEFGNPIIRGVKYLFTRVFTCWHVRLSRPFTHGKESYRVCLRCGMRREFDLQSWKSVGRFY
jgi:hypothetical protein